MNPVWAVVTAGVSLAVAITSACAAMSTYSHLLRLEAQLSELLGLLTYPGGRLDDEPPAGTGRHHADRLSEAEATVET